MDLKAWNKEIKQLREIILKPDKIEESKIPSLGLHSMVHSSEMSGIDRKTFEDELWEDMKNMRSDSNKKGEVTG